MHTHHQTSTHPRRHQAPSIVIRVVGPRHHRSERLIVTIGANGPRNQGHGRHERSPEFRAEGSRRHRHHEFAPEFRAEGSRRHRHHELAPEFQGGGSRHHRQHDADRAFHSERSRRRDFALGFNDEHPRRGKRDNFSPESLIGDPPQHREDQPMSGFRAEGPRRRREYGCTCAMDADRRQRNGRRGEGRGMRPDRNRSFGHHHSMRRDHGHPADRRDW